VKEYIKKEVMRSICCKSKVYKNINLRNFKAIKEIGKHFRSSSKEKYF